MSAHQIVVNHRPQIVRRELFDLGHFVRGPKTIEEMYKRQTGFQGSGLGNQGHVHHRLHGMRSQHREAGSPHGHHVLVVAKDRQPLSGQRPRRDMKNRRRKFAGDLVHVRDHQQQPLRRGKGGRQRAPLQRAVHCPGGAPLTLHFHYIRHRAPNVLLSFRRPLVRPLTHRELGVMG